MRRYLIAAAVLLAGSITGAAFAQQGGIAASIAAAAGAPAGVYVSDPPHASLTWKVFHQRLSWYTARFTKFSLEVSFDPADVSKSKVAATVDPKSVETDFSKTRPAGDTRDFNNDIYTRFLQAEKFPKITFTSTAIKKTGEKNGVMTGNLTFLGVTKPATFEVVYTGDANDPRTQKHKVAFEATGSIKLSEFGLSPGFIGDEARLIIDAELIQK